MDRPSTEELQALSTCIDLAEERLEGYHPLSARFDGLPEPPSAATISHARNALNKLLS